MVSAGHFGFDGLLGFLPGFLPGFFPWLLLGGLSNHQEQHQQDDQVVPPHDVLRALAVRGMEPLCRSSPQSPLYLARSLLPPH